MTVGPTGVRAIRPYYSVASAYREPAASRLDAAKAAEAAAQVRAALLDSVRHHLVADVPVGAFLSAGIDSGSLVGLMRDAGQSEIATVTLGFAEFSGTENDETQLAESVAQRYATRHVTRLITEQEFAADLPLILQAMDQPSIDGFNTWFVSKAARELGLKVAISGLGGDELFGGYPSFEQVPRLARAMRLPARLPGLPGLVRRIAAAAGPARLGFNPKSAGLMEYGGTIEGAYLLRRGLFMPWELPSILGRDFAAEGLRRLQPLRHLAAAAGRRPRSRFAHVAALETGIYMRNQLLRDTDWASMAHGLEVRVPLVDHRLLEACAPHVMATWARGGRGKSLLAMSPSRPLPGEIVNRRKTGFSTPIAQWLGNAKLGKGRADTRPASAQSVRELAKLVLAC
jgi:asparagine synthase (glutamine-hydrolysing)